MATQNRISAVIPFRSPETQANESAELLAQLCQRFRRSNPTVEPRRIPTVKEVLSQEWQRLTLKYGCLACNLKRNGLLCRKCFSQTKRDIRRIVAYLAAAGY